MPSIRPVWRDLIAVAAVLAAAAVLWMCMLPGETGALVEISVSGQESRTYALTDDRTVTLSARGVDLTVVINGGEVCVADSTCPDGVCRAHGRISRTGESIVCAPAGVVVRITGGETYVDGVVG